MRTCTECGISEPEAKMVTTIHKSGKIYYRDVCVNCYHGIRHPSLRYRKARRKLFAQKFKLAMNW